jgi:hypothetical protein
MASQGKSTSKVQRALHRKHLVAAETAARELRRL